MHVIVTQGETPAVVSAHTDDLDALADVCQRIAAGGVGVILHSLTALGVLEPVRAWWAQDANRSITIPGEVVEDGGHIEAATDVVTETVDDEDETDTDEASDKPVGNAYCFGCKMKRDFPAEVRVLANGRRQATGKCEVCGRGMSQFLPKLDEDDEAEAEAASRVTEAAKRKEEKAQAREDAKMDKLWRPDDEPNADLDEPTDDEMESESNPDVDLSEDVAEAITEAADGMPVAEVAEAAQQVAIAFSAVAAITDEPIQLTDAQKVETKPRTRRTKAQKAKDVEAQQTEDAKRIASLPVAECLHCHEKQPVQERAGIRIMMVHSAPGTERCKGSTTVVN